MKYYITLRFLFYFIFFQLRGKRKFQEKHLKNRHTNEDQRFTSGQAFSSTCPKYSLVGPHWNWVPKHISHLQTESYCIFMKLGQAYYVCWLFAYMCISFSFLTFYFSNFWSDGLYFMSRHPWPLCYHFDCLFKLGCYLFL